MANDGRPGTPASKRILGLLLAVLGAIAGYFLARYLMSR
jgi:hypothetical protein